MINAGLSADGRGTRSARCIRAWLPVVAWMSLMFTMSTDLGSAASTSRFLEPLVRWLAPQVSPEMFASIHYLVRKAAHLAEYAILAVLVRRALTVGVEIRLPEQSWRPELLALAWAGVFAMSDEFHQGFVASRGASVRDVAIDTAGAAIGLAIMRIAMWFRR